MTRTKHLTLRHVGARLRVRGSRSPLAFSLFVFLLLAARPSFPVTTTDLNTTTPQQLAQMLAGPGITVSNVTFTGANVAGGSFTGGIADGLGIANGVILSTGNIAGAAGPNTSTDTTTVNNTPGDSDLNTILGAGATTFDAAVLQFDFVPSGSTLTFRYVFGSEEYNEFVGSSFNDVFAFLVDGQNVALIPGTNTPVAINSVNSTVNSAFFKNNDPEVFGTPTPFGTQFDGFTTVLTATVTLTPNVSHHIKLAIADTSDAVYDSAVFLEASSFAAPALTITKSAPTSVATGSNLTYTITYGNAGNAAATNVVVQDTIPAGTTFVSASNGGTLSSGVVSWNVGTLAAGATGLTLSLVVQVNAASGEVDNTNYTIAADSIAAIPGLAVSTLITGVCTVAATPAITSGGTANAGQPYILTWTATLAGPGQYLIMVSRDGVPATNLIATAPGLSYPTTASDAGHFFTFQVQAQPACGSSGNSAFSAPFTVTVGSACTPPGLPQSPTISPVGNKTGPVTGVDFLDLSWSAPAGSPTPTSYDWAINGDPFSAPTTQTTATAPPRGVDPTIQLHVRARACSPEVAGQPADSPVYSPAPPVAKFSFSVQSSTVTVTDASGPEATSWLWLWGDGTFSTGQAPGPHTYATPGTYPIDLIATNGAGESVASNQITTQSISLVPERITKTRSFDTTNPSRQRIATVQLADRGEVWLRIRPLEARQEEVSLYLRFLNQDGTLAKERRLSVSSEQTEALYDLNAYGLTGNFTVEVVSYRPFTTSLIEVASGMARKEASR